MDLQKCKEEYAELLVTGGICLKPGEKVIVNTDVSTREMALLTAKKCYEHGASKVEIRWSCGQADALDYAYGDLEAMKRVDAWEEERMKQQVEELPCMIHLLASEPLAYTDKMVEHQAKITKARFQVLLKYREQMQDKYKWTVGGIPTESWAGQVFPGEERGLERLWREVLETLYISGDGTSQETWEKKWEASWSHMDALNEMGLRSLHMTTGLGTDLTLELHPDAQWHCGAFRERGFAANLPSEELYTSPLAGKAEGTLVASCPLIYSNQRISGLCLTFCQGKVVQVSAEEGETFFQNLVETDEGASMVGEVAIVDRYSPIRKAGHLFYHTLYDENAACHVAVGRGFPFVLKNFEAMTDEQRLNCGLNNSAIHCDIMWGTDDTRITGTREDGSRVLIMEQGEWRL